MELLERSEELETRRTEEYEMGSLKVRCGPDGALRSDRRYGVESEDDEFLGLHFAEVKRCAITKSKRQ